MNDAAPSSDFRPVPGFRGQLARVASHLLSPVTGLATYALTGGDLATTFGASALASGIGFLVGSCLEAQPRNDRELRRQVDDRLVTDVGINAMTGAAVAAAANQSPLVGAAFGTVTVFTGGFVVPAVILGGFVVVGGIAIGLKAADSIGRALTHRYER